MAISFTTIGLAEPSTITHRVSAVTIARGSTNEQQEILCLGDGQSSLGIAVVTDTTPASTAFGLVVREAVAQSTTVNVSSLAGTVSIAQASTTFAVQLSQYSTVTAVSSVSGRVLVDRDSTTWAVQLSQYSTTVNVSSLAGQVKPAIPASFTYGQVTLGSTAAQIAAASTARARLVVVQCSTIDVYLGASTVTSTSGILLAGVRGNQFIFRSDDAVSGISTGGSPVVSFCEETY